MAAELIPEIPADELRVMLRVLARKTGYDLRDYATASLHRRVQRHLARIGAQGSLLGWLPRVLDEPAALDELIADISVPVTEMFRDPDVHRCLRMNVLPELAKLPFIKIWYAGCATGEEVYSLAIMLLETGLYERCRIFATDFSNLALDRAREGIYPLHVMRRYSANYFRAGGRVSLGEYYRTGYGYARLDPNLRRRIVFARHDLACDQPFTDSHLVLCRNVMIYFNRELQSRVFQHFGDRLHDSGFLCLGRRERLPDVLVPRFETVAAVEKIYRKEGACW